MPRSVGDTNSNENTGRPDYEAYRPVTMSCGVSADGGNDHQGRHRECGSDHKSFAPASVGW
jgi:hypothetical protein